MLLVVLVLRGHFTSIHLTRMAGVWFRNAINQRTKLSLLIKLMSIRARMRKPLYSSDVHVREPKPQNKSSSSHTSATNDPPGAELVGVLFFGEANFAMFAAIRRASSRD
jgi:hypothetical protein